MKKSKVKEIIMVIPILFTVFFLSSCQPVAEHSPVTLQSKIDSAKNGDVIDLSEEVLQINQNENYTITKNLTIKNGSIKNSSIIFTGDTLYLENINSINDLFLEGEDCVEDNFDIGVHLINTSIKTFHQNRRNCAIYMTEFSFINLFDIKTCFYISTDDTTFIADNNWTYYKWTKFSNEELNNFRFSGREAIQKIQSPYLKIYKENQLIQKGARAYIYNYPKNKYVAECMGLYPINLFSVKVLEKKGTIVLDEGSFELNPTDEHKTIIKNKINEDVLIGVYPSDLKYVEKPAAINDMQVKIVDKKFMGTGHYYITTVTNKGNYIKLDCLYEAEYRLGDSINLIPDMTKVYYFSLAENDDGINLLYNSQN